jgi:hypothetical protein
MSNESKDTKVTELRTNGELSNKELDGVAGGMLNFSPVSSAIKNGDFFGALKALGDYYHDAQQLSRPR